MARLPKLSSTVSDIFKEGEFSHQKNFSHQFLSLSWWFAGLGKKIRSVSKAAIYVSAGTFCLNTVSEKKVQHFCIFSKKILLILGRDCLLDCQTFLLRVHRNFLREEKTEKKVILIPFFTLGKKFSNFCPKVPSRAVRAAFLYPEDEFQERNCFWKYRILQFSPTSSRTFRTVSDNFLAGFSFMHFVYPKGGFGRDFCLESGLHNHGLHAIKFFGLFQKKIARVIKSKSHVSRWSYWRKIFFEVFVSFFTSGLWAKTFQEIWRIN